VDVEAGADTSAFDVIFDEHYLSVLRYAQRRTDPQTAQDVAADVMVTAWRRRHEVPDDVRPWLIATARRTLANHRRSQGRLVSLRRRLASQPRPPAASVGDMVDVQLSWAQAFAHLSPSDQEVLTLIAWDGLTTKEAAASLGCSASAFTTRLNRARTRLVADRDQGNQVSVRGSARNVTKGR
jgi:RNA polymerase sigma-70 factor (ECF subfamily)